MLDSVSVKGLQRSPASGCGAAAEVASFRAVSLLPGTSPATKSVLQQMEPSTRKKDRRKEARLLTLLSVLAPGPTATSSFLRSPCLSSGVEVRRQPGRRGAVGFRYERPESQEP